MMSNGFIVAGDLVMVSLPGMSDFVSIPNNILSEIVALVSNPTVIAVVSLLAVAVASQKGVIGGEGVTWVGVISGGFVAGRLFGPKIIDRSTETAISAVSKIPVVGDALVGVVV